MCQTTAGIGPRRCNQKRGIGSSGLTRASATSASRGSNVASGEELRQRDELGAVGERARHQRLARLEVGLDVGDPWLEPDCRDAHALEAIRGRGTDRWYDATMRATIDGAGRLVIPKPLRDHLGLSPGVVDVIVDGAGLRVEPPAAEALEERDGRLVIPASGAAIDDDTVRALRNADQR